MSSSVVNSALDIRTNLMLIWAARSIKKHDPYKYPAGNLFSISIQIKTNLNYSL